MYFNDIAKPLIIALDVFVHVFQCCYMLRVTLWAERQGYVSHVELYITQTLYGIWRAHIWGKCKVWSEIWKYLVSLGISSGDLKIHWIGLLKRVKNHW